MRFKHPILDAACPISRLEMRLLHSAAQINLTSREVLWTIIPRKFPAQILPRVAWYVFYLLPTLAKPFRWFNYLFPRGRFLWKVHNKSSTFTKTHNRSVKQKETQQFLGSRALPDKACGLSIPFWMPHARSPGQRWDCHTTLLKLIWPRGRFLWEVHHKSSIFTKTHNRSVKKKETQQIHSSCGYAQDELHFGPILRYNP